MGCPFWLLTFGERMKEADYFAIRKIAFWLFVVVFLFSSFPILFYSLGYKFDIKAKKFIKTGTVSIKTHPVNAEVYLNDRRLEKTTPCILSELSPGTYTIALEKDNFYLYKTFVEVRPSFVTELEVVFVPKIKDLKKIDFVFDVYKFFFLKHFFTDKLVIFSNQGIFLSEKNFKNLQKLSKHDLGIKTAAKLSGVLETGDTLLFWNTDTIWKLDVAAIDDHSEIVPVTLYEAEKILNNVFLGIRDKYIIVRDGLDINVFEINNNQAVFPIMKLKDSASEVFYDSASETLYVKEKIPQSGSYSIFRAEFFPSFLEKLKNEKIF